jgi:hypothetical protein
MILHANPRMIPTMQCTQTHTSACNRQRNYTLVKMESEFIVKVHNHTN